MGLLLGTAIVVAAVFWWQAARNTPEATVKAFTTELSEGKADAAYKRLTADLTRGREDYWQTYLKQFTPATSEPTFGKEDQVIDSFNTYTATEEPRRFTYTFHMKGKDYRAVILLIKEGKVWKVDELYGSAVK